MFLQRLRLGFATNSSSSHSLVYIPNNTKVTCNRLPYSDSWGWDEFVLATPEAKASYLLSHVFNKLSGIMPDEYAKAVVEHLLASDMRVKIDPDLITGVDHQSQITIPYSKPMFDNVKEVDMNFFTNVFTKIIQSPDYVIVGGNDNSDNMSLETIQRAGTTSVIRTDDENIYKWLAKDGGRDQYASYGPVYSISNFITRQDGRFWTMFNKSNGAKITFATQPPDEYDKRESYTYSTVPELVDLKITDRCTSNCEFCYANSAHDGKHATMNNISSITSALRELGVFEVTLGGGEPTSHPDFYEIVRLFNNAGVVVNFTTNSRMFLCKDIDEIERRKKETMKLVGAMAVTVHGLSDCIRAIRFNERCGGSIVFQIPMGTVERDDFHAIVSLAKKSGIRVTLLGYKNVGRGKDYRPTAYDWWTDEIEHVNDYDDDDWYWQHNVIGIDTAIAAQYQNKLKELGVPEYMYYLQEGNFSCAIDAVNMTIARSSYSDEELSIEPSRSVSVASLIKKHYSTFREA